jgi:alkanesulfonate monooxygenase SsuD/methylene tetrahydromethanopterin reductase-like flavin-dependent oxidoreductase (luciferase family)
VEGRDFAVEQSDFLFTSLIDLDRARNNVAALKAQAQGRHNRSIEVLGVGHVVCRPTRQEALDYYDYYANQKADWRGVDGLLNIQSKFAKSFTPEEIQRLRIRFAGGHGTYPLVGSPDDVADELDRIAQTGLAGIAFSFVNYLDELPYFCAEVLPRLKRRAH